MILPVQKDEFETSEDWHPGSGYVPLLEAKDRLAAARRAVPAIAALIDQLNLEAATESESSIRAIAKNKQAAEFLFENRQFAEEQLLAIQTELPVMLSGSLILYLFSVLESCLAGCLETAAAVRGRASPTRVSNPLIEGYLTVLADTFGVSIEWSDEVWAEIRRWRKERNLIAHRLDTHALMRPSRNRSDEMLGQSSLECAVDLVELTIEEIDLAMTALQKDAEGRHR